MSNEKILQLVKSATGTAGSGNCLIGPYLPFGMARPGPDAPMPQRNNGYAPGEPLVGFSLNRMAGTGGPPRGGHVMVSPFVGPPARREIMPFIRPPLQRRQDARPTEEQTAVGYYAVRVQPWNILAELTATRHVGVERYTFPAGGEPHLLLIPSSCLKSGSMPPGSGETVAEWDSAPASTGGYLEILNDREIAGRADFRGGWGHDKPHSTYFFFRSDVPFRPVQFANHGGVLDAAESMAVCGPEIRVLLAYGQQRRVQVQIGISQVSVANARGWVEQEAGDRSFEAVRAAGEAEWSAYLERFSVEGGTLEQRQMFYSMLYRLLCMPTDLGVDQENPFWKSGVRQYTDFCCLWDSIRNANSFFHLFFPEQSRDQMNALLDIAEHTGWLPDAHISGYHAYMQSACACDILFPEAARKGVPGVDYARALQYLRKNCETPSPDVLTRGRYLADYHELGYLSTRVSKGAVSRHLEYCYHDWCIAQLARQVGDTATAERCEQYARRVWNLWREDLRSFAPRQPDGTWVAKFDPYAPVPESWNDQACYEGTAAIWSCNVFQDFPGLIARCGGTAAFLAWLDERFERKLFEVKETRMHVPHLYTYAGRPDRAADRIREALAQFAPTPTGVPDNEDMGCQSGFFLWHALGLYPIYGQTHYMLTPPLFDKITARLGDQGPTLRITAERRGQGRYITECRLGGRPVDRAWLQHAEILAQPEIHFVLADTPGAWGTRNPPTVT